MNRAIIIGVLTFALILVILPASALAYTPYAGTISPTSGYGYSHIFTTRYYDGDGFRDLAGTRLLFNTTTTAAGGFYVHYNQNTNRFYVWNGLRWLGGYAPRATQTVSVSGGKLFMRGTYPSGLNGWLTVRWSVGYNSAVYGKTLNSYLMATDDHGGNSGWKKRGTWRVPRPTPTTTAFGIPIFPADNPWNTDISTYPVHPNSTNFINNMAPDTGLHPDFGTTWNGGPNGIPYCVIGAGVPTVPITFYYPDESDPGPYPIPADAPREWGSDHHISVVDTDAKKLYEVYDATKTSWGWSAGSGAVFDLTSNALRPDGWTSADAAGLPIFPGLVKYDEVQKGVINHALRFTVERTQRGYIHPATHLATDDTDPNLPPMGLRVRLKSSFDISSFSPRLQVILRTLKKYGMFVADNGGDWYISGAPDMRWNDEELHDIERVKASDFEAVYTGPIQH